MLNDWSLAGGLPGSTARIEAVGWGEGRSLRSDERYTIARSSKIVYERVELQGDEKGRGRLVWGGSKVVGVRGGWAEVDYAAAPLSMTTLKATPSVYTQCGLSTDLTKYMPASNLGKTWSEAWGSYEDTTALAPWQWPISIQSVGRCIYPTSASMDLVII